MIVGFQIVVPILVLLLTVFTLAVIAFIISTIFWTYKELRKEYSRVKSLKNAIPVSIGVIIISFVFKKIKDIKDKKDEK